MDEDVEVPHLEALSVWGLPHMNNKYRCDSRRATPWEDKLNATPVEKFIDGCTKDNYDKKHTRPGDDREINLLNSFIPSTCRLCNSTNIIRYGKTAAGLIRYRCKDCGKTFTIITGTIFDQRKISISEWIDFLVMLMGYGSYNLTSKINRNSYNTTRYWMDKVFLILRGWQDNIILNGDIYFDETYYPLMAKDSETNDKGFLKRGLSKNRICIGCGWDGRNLVCISEGTGKTSKTRTWDAFGSHINKGAKLIHDGEHSHSVLVDNLELNEEIHPTKETKGLSDKHNPMDPINSKHSLLKKFLRAHSGFIRDDIQDYLNFFCFITSNTGLDKLEKVRDLLILAFENPKILRYRDKNLDSCF